MKALTIFFSDRLLFCLPKIICAWFVTFILYACARLRVAFLQRTIQITVAIVSFLALDGCMTTLDVTVNRLCVNSRVFDEYGKPVPAYLFYNLEPEPRIFFLRTKGARIRADSNGWLHGEVRERWPKILSKKDDVDEASWDGAIDTFIAAPGYAPVRYIGQREVLLIKAEEFSEIKSESFPSCPGSRTEPWWVTFKNDDENRRIPIIRGHVFLNYMSESERSWRERSIREALGTDNPFVEYGPDNIIIYELDCRGLDVAEKVWSNRGLLPMIPYPEMRNYLPVEKRHKGKRDWGTETKEKKGKMANTGAK